MNDGARIPGSPFADRLRQDGAVLAAELTREATTRNPDLLARSPRRGRIRTEKDYGWAIQYLAVSLDLGNAAPFLEFCRWAAGVLGARGVSASAFADAMDHIREHLQTRYGAERDPATDAALLAAAGEVRSSAPGSAEVAPDPGGAHREARSAFLVAILDGDRAAALGVLREALADGTPLRDVSVEILGAALREVGERWAANRITVADEHLATAAAQSVLAHLYADLPATAKTRGRVVIAGVEGELHQIGAHVVADLLESDGFEVRFLGTNLPADAVARCAEEWNADALGISMTMLHHLPRLGDLIDAVRERAGRRLPIVLGGGALRAVPDLAARAGADEAVTDLADLFPLFRRLAGG